MKYLKYYFGRKDGKLYFGNIACDTDEIPIEPENFVKWYEDGDFAPVSFTEDQKKAILRSDSPVVMAMFAPREVTFK